MQEIFRYWMCSALNLELAILVQACSALAILHDHAVQLVCSELMESPMPDAKMQKELEDYIEAHDSAAGLTTTPRVILPLILCLTRWMSGVSGTSCSDFASSATRSD